MIPSDHFVRFYNEVFKFLDEKDSLQDYYDVISHHQQEDQLENFRSKGLRGVYEYYQRIYKEENCQGSISLNGHELILRMDRCPSLSKAKDNDAGLCRKYCLHCPGWTLELYRKAGLYQVMSLEGLENPQCTEWIYDDLEMAEAKYRELAGTVSAEELFCSFPPPVCK